MSERTICVELGKSGVDCVSCGTSFEECSRTVLSDYLSCCSGCRYRDTHAEREEPATTVYKIQVPPEPEGVTRVRPVSSEWEYERQESGRWKDAHGLLNDWYVIMLRHPDGLEPVPEESEYDAAVSWFRVAYSGPHAIDDAEFYRDLEAGKHAAAIVRGVLAGEK